MQIGTRPNLRSVQAVPCSSIARHLTDGFGPVIETLEGLTGEDLLSTDDPLAAARAKLGCSG